MHGDSKICSLQVFSRSTLHYVGHYKHQIKYFSFYRPALLQTDRRMYILEKSHYITTYHFASPEDCIIWVLDAPRHYNEPKYHGSSMKIIHLPTIYKQRKSETITNASHISPLSPPSHFERCTRDSRYLTTHLTPVNGGKQNNTILLHIK
jgi:hypothetical protein